MSATSENEQHRPAHALVSTPEDGTPPETGDRRFGLFSAAAQLYWLASEGRHVRAGHLVRDAGVATTALLFSFWSLAGSGYQAAYYGLFCLLLGIPVYVWLKAERPMTDPQPPILPAVPEGASL